MVISITGILKPLFWRACPDAVMALFHCSIGKSCEMKLHSSCHTYLNFYRIDFQSIDGSAICLYQHGTFLKGWFLYKQCILFDAKIVKNIDSTNK